MQLHFQNREYFSVTCHDGFSLDIINKPFDLNYSFLCTLTFCDFFFLSRFSVKAWKKIRVFLRLLFHFDSFVAKIKIFITRDRTVKNYHNMFEKGTLQNHSFLSRTIWLEVSESFSEIKYGLFFLICFSSNAYIFILFLLSVVMPSFISALVSPTVQSPVSFILSFLLCSFIINNIHTPLFPM